MGIRVLDHKGKTVAACVLGDFVIEYIAALGDLELEHCAESILHILLVQEPSGTGLNWLGRCQAQKSVHLRS